MQYLHLSARKPAQPPAPAPPPAPVAAPASASASDITYNFDYDGEKFTLNLPEEATCGDAKTKIAERYGTEAEHVKLFFAGRNIKDDWALVKQRIGTNDIVVTIMSMDTLLLVSARHTSNLSPNQREEVNKLSELSGKNLRTCERCYIFHEYDYKAALAELTSTEDSPEV